MVNERLKMIRDRKLPHTFHIPVMGTGYTIDTPVKVAHFGINSVISIIDHRIIEEMREFHCKLNGLPYIPISEEEDDCRAKRITAYLNLIKSLVDNNFEQLKKSSFEQGSEIAKYFEMLPEDSQLKEDYNAMLQSDEESKKSKQALLKEKMLPGRIDVNIMTKLDRVNYSRNNEPLPVEYNDAHAALKGFANSDLESSIVLSAGLNPRLFGYMAGFECFFPDNDGRLKKKIILKVSDYRSALIQGKLLAKKGLWVSEYRIESGLNCGGHAFATNGYLLGPILNEFKENKAALTDELTETYSAALKTIQKKVPNFPPTLTITAQGGVGTFDEHLFLLDNYGVDSVGWGSPFLLVPDVVNIDKESMELISETDEKGFYLSGISPLGILFNTVKGNSGEIEKQKRINNGKPGASCIKKHLELNTEFTEKPVCSSSRIFQKMKIEELGQKNLNTKEYEKQFKKITDKVCLCVSLGNSTLLKNNMWIKPGIRGVSVCPGPNMAFFSKIVSLQEMVDHIYGRAVIIKRDDRPNMFIQELKMYIDYFKSKIEDFPEQPDKAQLKYYLDFQKNLNEGIEYYKNLFSTRNTQFNGASVHILKDLTKLQSELNSITAEKLQTAVC
jgi:hypothetical protein